MSKNLGFGRSFCSLEHLWSIWVRLVNPVGLEICGLFHVTGRAAGAARQLRQWALVRRVRLSATEEALEEVWVTLGCRGGRRSALNGDAEPEPSMPARAGSRSGGCYFMRCVLALSCTVLRVMQIDSQCGRWINVAAGVCPRTVLVGRLVQIPCPSQMASPPLSVDLSVHHQT